MTSRVKWLLLSMFFSAALAGGTAIPLSRGLEVLPEYGTAIEALLGSAAEAISVSDGGD